MVIVAYIDVVEGGRRERGGYENTHKYIKKRTHPSCYKEDGGRCGNGGADLERPAPSLLKGGEFSHRLAEVWLAVRVHLQPSTAVSQWCVFSGLCVYGIVASRFVDALRSGYTER